MTSHESKEFPFFSLPLGIFGTLRKSTSDLRNTIVCSCDSVRSLSSVIFIVLVFIILWFRGVTRCEFNFWIFSATIKTQRCLSPRIFWLKSSRSKWWLAESRSQINMAKLPRIVLLEKPRHLILTTYMQGFKYIATILIESYEIKILISLSSPMLNKHQLLLVNFNRSIASFVRSTRWIPSSPILSSSPLLKRRQ